MTNLRFALILFLLGCGSPPPAQVPQAPTPAPAPEAEESGDWIVSPVQDPTRFRNVEGIRAYLVPVHSRSDPTLRNRYLLRITGSSSKYDGLVLVVHRTELMYNVVFFAQLHGKPARMLQYRKPISPKNSDPIWTLFGYDMGVKHGVVKKVEDSFDPKEVVQLHHEQQGQSISEIETLDRASIMEAANKQHQLHVANLAEDCGKIESSIDWSNVPDSLPREVSIANMCSAHIASLKQFCTRHPGRLQREKQTIKLRCVFDDNPTEERARPMKVDQEGRFVHTAGPYDDGSRQRLHLLRTHYGEEKQVFRSDSKTFILHFLPEKAQLYLGDGNVFSPIATSHEIERNHYTLPSGATKGTLVRKATQWILVCDDERTPLETLEGKARQSILDEAKLETEPTWKRSPYFLARDAQGSYYYVDRFQRSHGGGRYRVFVGRKGQLVPYKLKRLVEDSEGKLFSTNKGQLRLTSVSGKKSAVWIKGKKVTTLTSVNLRASAKLIFDELGVYYGEKLGLPCE